MPEVPNRLAAIKEDGFIDFYQLLEVEPDATLTRIRTTINALYNEAQSNRDHRNLNRRREYQTLLQLLPQARELLLEDKRRARYDAFRDEVERGVTSISFEDWARALKEEEEGTKGDRSSVLGIQEEERKIGDGDGVPRATVIKTTKPKPTASRVVVGDDSSTRPVRRSAKKSLIASAISMVVFFVVLLLSYAVIKDRSVAMLIGAIAGLITWFVTHRNNTSRTSV